LRLRTQTVDETEQDDFNSLSKKGAERIKFNSLNKIEKVRTPPAADGEADVRADSEGEAKGSPLYGRQAI